MKILQGINRTFTTSQLIIDGMLADPQLIKMMEPYGYNRKQFQQGKAQFTKTRMLFDSKDACYQEKKRATQQLNEYRQQLRQLYMKHAGILRAYYRKDILTRQELGIAQSTPQGLDRFLTHVQRFYSKALTLAEGVEGYPVLPAEIAQAQEMITAISQTRLLQMSKKREAQRTTQQQNEALAELRQWVRDFLAIAKIAFRHDPQQLEALGITVKAA